MSESLLIFIVIIGAIIFVGYFIKLLQINESCEVAGHDWLPFGRCDVCKKCKLIRLKVIK